MNNESQIKPALLPIIASSCRIRIYYTSLRLTISRHYIHSASDVVIDPRTSYLSTRCSLFNALCPGRTIASLLMITRRKSWEELSVDGALLKVGSQH